MDDLTPQQADVLLHTLGLSEPGSSSTRNLFVTGKGDPHLADLETLVAAGLMRETRRPGFLSEGDRVFMATDAGLARALSIQPKPPKIARAKVEELEDAEHDRRRQWARIEVGDIDEDARKVCLEVQEDAARTLAACLLGAIGDAPHYIEQVLDIGGNTSMSLHFADVSLVVTTQRAGAKTPHQLRMEAEAERDQARAELANLRALLDPPTTALAARE